MAFFVDDRHRVRVGRVSVAVIAAILAVILFLWTLVAGVGVYSRWNRVQDANNKAKTARINAANQTQVNELMISANEQQVKIHQQQAEIRRVDAVGVREAQDEISKTLTPLYVQFEMVDALKQIAESGKNNTVVYIPTGANGIPLISNADQNQVGTPKG